MATRLFCSLLVSGVIWPAMAQTVPGSGKRSGSVEGSPLDTILSTRLWTTPPTARDFVRESRPAPSTLDYTPLHGEDPKRPKPLDAKGVKALQAELEHDIEANEKRAQALGGVIKPASATKGGSAKTGTQRHAKKVSAKGAAPAAD